jgi:hypothetical protein
MKFLDAHKQQHEAEQAKSYEAYRELLHKAAATDDGSLSKEDQKTFDKAVSVLGYQPERIEADAATLMEAKRLTARQADYEVTYQARIDAQRIADEHNRHMEAAIKELQERSMQLGIAANEAVAKFAVRQTARGELEKLKNQHHQLFALEDPAIVARRRHLAYGVLTPQKVEGARYDVVYIESIMQDRRTNQNLDGIEWVRMDGQTDEQFAELQALLATIYPPVSYDVRQRIRPIYVKFLTTVDRETVPQCKGSIVHPDAILSQESKPTLYQEWADFQFIKFPTDNAEDFAAAYAKVQAKLQRIQRSIERSEREVEPARLVREPAVWS